MKTHTANSKRDEGQELSGAKIASLAKLAGLKVTRVGVRQRNAMRRAWQEGEEAFARMTPEDLASMKAIASVARIALHERRMPAYRRYVKRIATVAAGIGARVVDRRDLGGMVVGLEFPPRTGPRYWVLLS